MGAPDAVNGRLDRAFRLGHGPTAPMGRGRVGRRCPVALMISSIVATEIEVLRPRPAIFVNARGSPATKHCPCPCLLAAIATLP